MGNGGNGVKTGLPEQFTPRHAPRCATVSYCREARLELIQPGMVAQGKQPLNVRSWNSDAPGKLRLCLPRIEERRVQIRLGRLQPR
jgi:hypothetical protein